MIDFDENLEQLSLFEVSSQGEKLSQEKLWAEETKNKRGSKELNGLNSKPALTKEADNFDNSNKNEEGNNLNETKLNLNEFLTNENQNVLDVGVENQTSLMSEANSSNEVVLAKKTSLVGELTSKNEESLSTEENVLNKKSLLNKVGSTGEEDESLTGNFAEKALDNTKELKVEGFDLPNSKFKSVEELGKAYDNLQSDYTRKCQMLASLQKEIEDNKAKALPEVKFHKLLEDLQEFLKQNLDAKDYASELTKMVLEDENIKNSASPINEAWEKIKQKDFISKKSVLQDEEFLASCVLKNNNLRERIIKDYFSNITINSSPNLITSNCASCAVVASPEKPKSIKEAGKLARDILWGVFKNL